MLGSSTAAGAGASAGQGWVSLLAAAYQGTGVTMINLAVGGSTSYHALALSSPAVAGRPAPDARANVDAALALLPKLLMLSFPSNDTALGYTVDETVRNLLAVRQTAVAGGAAVVLLSTQPRVMTAELLARQPLIDAQLQAAAGPCFVALRERLADAQGRLSVTYDSGDGVHPNAAGHALIATQVRATLDAGQCVKPPQ